MDKQLRAILGGDVFHGTCPIRSRTMSAIRHKNTKTTERALQMKLVREGISGWTRHIKTLPGHPDFVFEQSKLVIFVDGCFWHYCERCGHIPKTRSVFWYTKLQNTKARDKRNSRKLKKMGFTVLRFWEHQLTSPRGLALAFKRIHRELSSM